MTWALDGEVELVRVRFAAPYPTNVSAQTTFDFEPLFHIVAFPPRYPDPLPISLENLYALYEQVRQIVDALDPQTQATWNPASFRHDTPPSGE